MERPIIRSLLLGTALQTSLTIALALPAQAQPAPNAHPTGGVVIAGSAAISQTANNTAINQSTQRAAVNWQSFNVGSQQSVTFNQPSPSAVTLNRVVGPDPSQIAGRIDANGQIVLTNQSGVTFFKGAQVNTNGLVVSAIGMTKGSVSNFMANGQVVLDKPGNPNAAVINNGNITVRQAGLAALVAPQVANRGTITATLGHVVLAGAKTATLDLYGDGLLSLDVNNQVTQAPLGKDGKAVTALVTNTGTIIADGGTVQLTARATDGIVQNLVDASGTIRAATMGDHTGTLALNGVGGSIIVEGQLSAVGSTPGTTGGAIEVVTNKAVTIASTAKINASGRAGGGTVAIGTTLARAAGGPGVTATQTAANVTVRQGATIAANATGNGNGGHVAVLSFGTTQMDGLITAKGGASGGNGGFVEVSGVNLGMTGRVNVSAPSGAIGTILLDPLNLNIVPSGGNLDGSFTGTVTFGSDPGLTDSLSASVLSGFSGNVLLQATNTIDVQSSFSIPAGTLTMEAGEGITVDPGKTMGAGGNIILATGGAGPGTPPPAGPTPLITIGGTVTSTGGTVSLLSGTNGTISFGSAGSVAATGITLNSGAGGISLAGSAVLGQSGSTIDITSAGPVSQATTSTILATTLGSTGGVTGTVNLAGTNNAISVIGALAVTGGDLNVVTTSNLTLAGAQSANNLFFKVAQGGGTLTFGTVRTRATLTTGPSGRISLVADNYNVANAASTVTTNGGRVELAPFSPIAASLLGSGGLVIDNTLLSIIQTNGGTLTVGGFTNAPLGATTPVPSASSVDIGAALDLSAIASTLQIESTGAITESGGPLTVTNLAGNGGAWTLNNNANAISTVGTVVATDFALNDSLNLAINGTVASSIAATINTTGALTVNGEVGAPTFVLTGTNITVPGTLAGGTLAFNTTGAFSETGVMNIGTLIGVASGAITLSGANQIGALNGISASSFSLNDSTNLLISGALEAPNITILDPANQITLGNGAAIFTGGSVRPSGPIQPALEPTNGAPGTYLQAASFVQVGTSFVFSPSSGPTTLQISTTGNMQFDPPLGLQGTSDWLILNLTNGTAAGNVFVNALDVSYSVPGSAGLFGTIAGIAGGPAATLGFILPAINTNYRFNGCIIEAALCNPLPTSTPTTTTTSTQLSNGDITSALGGLYPFLPGAPPPLVGISNLVLVALPLLPAAAPQLTDPDVVPPNISYLDY